MVEQSGGGKDDLKSVIQVWLQLDAEIDKYQEKIKEYKKQKEAISPKIIEFMNKNKFNAIESNDNVIKYRKTNTRETINRNYLIEKLKQLYKDEKKAVETTEYLLESRKIIEKYSLEKK